jgi:hypothetical protein
MLDQDDRRLTRPEAQCFLRDRGFRVASATLSKYATVGGGPEYEKFGRRVLYRPSKLLEWVAAKTGKPQTSSSAWRR